MQHSGIGNAPAKRHACHSGFERSRTFIVREQGSDVKVPTDLLGITPLTYVYRGTGNLSAAVAPVCTELRKVINNLGVR